MVYMDISHLALNRAASESRSFTRTVQGALRTEQNATLFRYKGTKLAEVVYNLRHFFDGVINFFFGIVSAQAEPD